MRRCVVCGASLSHCRIDARHCSGACRAEASRWKRILRDESADGYDSVAARTRALRQRGAPTPMPAESRQ